MKRAKAVDEKADAPIFIPTGYPSDLSDGEWGLIKGFFPQGPNSAYHKRSLVNAVFYLIDNGCK